MKKYISYIPSMISMEDRKQKKAYLLREKKNSGNNVTVSPVYGIATSIFFLKIKH